jgi:hypothetical protein
VSESSGNATTRAPADETAAAWAAAFAATSYGTHGGWAAATVSGSATKNAKAPLVRGSRAVGDGAVTAIVGG